LPFCYALTPAKEAFEPLVRDHENTEFVLSLDDPDTVETLGIFVQNIRYLISANFEALETNRERTDNVSTFVLDATAATVITKNIATALRYVNDMLARLRKKPYTG
jgi:hypothetical protein